MATATDVPPALSVTTGPVLPRRWKRLQGYSFLVLGVLPLLSVLVTAVLAPVISAHDPALQDLAHRLQPPMWQEGGSSLYPLGTDQLGRDVLTRIFYGGRVSLLVGLAATVGAGLLGTALGLMAGYLGGRVETVIMAVADVQLALPFVVLALAVIGVTGPGLQNVIILLIVTQWVVFGRVMRAQTLSIKQSDYVLAARATGTRHLDIILRHILPNAMGPILALAIPSGGRMILAEAALSFLGLGVQPPTATWGGILADGRGYLRASPWLSIAPGLAIMITVLGMNLIGEWLRLALDPKQRRG